MTTRLGAAGLGISLEQFLKNQNTESTREAYSNDLCQLVDFLVGIGVVAWADVTSDALQEYVANLQDQAYSEATQARKVGSLRSFFAYLARQGTIAQNPAPKIKIPQVDRHMQQHPLTRKQMTKLLKEAAQADGAVGLRDRAILELLYATGLRVSELVSLNMQDTNLQESYIRCWGKGARQRIVDLNPRALAALKDCLAISRPVLVRTHKEERALFINHRGGRLTRQWVWAILKTYGKKAGIRQHITLHTLRYSSSVHRGLSA